MSRLVQYCNASFTGLHSLLPLLGALLARRANDEFIVDSIPGIGQCRSVYCRAQRRAVAR